MQRPKDESGTQLCLWWGASGETAVGSQQLSARRGRRWWPQSKLPFRRGSNTKLSSIKLSETWQEHFTPWSKTLIHPKLKRIIIMPLFSPRHLYNFAIGAIWWRQTTGIKAQHVMTASQFDDKQPIVSPNCASLLSWRHSAAPKQDFPIKRG